MKYDSLVVRVNQIINSYTMQLTLRQIYYRLVAAGNIENTRSNYNQLSSQLVKARESGEVDDSRIVDRSRRIDDVSFDSPEDFMKACLNTLKQNYVRRFWETQPVYCELWVEKDALSQVFAEAIYPFNTIVAPSKGYSSYTYLQDAANRIRQYCRGGKIARILHFADHDPSGIDMSRDLQSRLANYGGENIEVLRIALTFSQVQGYGLIPNPAKTADPRSQSYIEQYGGDCWELDAVEPTELISLCREAVDSQIFDKPAWEQSVETERQERDKLIDRIKNEPPAVGQFGTIVPNKYHKQRTAKNSLQFSLFEGVV